MQKALNACAGADLSGDGEFGLKTVNALKVFQKTAGLPVTGRGDAAMRAALGLVPPVEKPTEPGQPTSGIRVTGDTVNIRTGPGTVYDVVKAVAKNTVLTPAITDGWYPIMLGGEVFWISKEYSQEVNA